VSGFSSEWLALREGADARARDASLVDALTAGRPPGRGLRVVDLGSGRGANLRYLAPRLGRGQHWVLVDNDPALLRDAPGAIQAWAHSQGHGVTGSAAGMRIEGAAFSAQLRWLRLDLADGLPALPLHDADLVTASALLDLASRDWIDRLARSCRAHHCRALFALTYDGRIAWRPALPGDEAIRRGVNRHQERDKGFGPAAGPEAWRHGRNCLQAAGYRVREGRSDWRLDAADGSLQAALARGWAQAARETDSGRGREIDLWLDRRLAHIARQESRLTVGHVDLLALP
jgi:SAM-dependent methyltransferase